MSHANYQSSAPCWIVKCRDRFQHETSDYRGVRRRTRKWGPWVGVLYGLTEQQAREQVAQRMRTGLSEWGAFHRGKRVYK